MSQTFADWHMLTFIFSGHLLFCFLNVRRGMVWDLLDLDIVMFMLLLVACSEFEKFNLNWYYTGLLPSDAWIEAFSTYHTIHKYTSHIFMIIFIIGEVLGWRQVIFLYIIPFWLTMSVFKKIQRYYTILCQMAYQAKPCHEKLCKCQNMP